MAKPPETKPQKTWPSPQKTWSSPLNYPPRYQVGPARPAKPRIGELRDSSPGAGRDRCREATFSHFCRQNAAKMRPHFLPILAPKWSFKMNSF